MTLIPSFRGCEFVDDMVEEVAGDGAGARARKNGVDGVEPTQQLSRIVGGLAVWWRWRRLRLRLRMGDGEELAQGLLIPLGELLLELGAMAPAIVEVGRPCLLQRRGVEAAGQRGRPFRDGTSCGRSSTR